MDDLFSFGEEEEMVLKAQEKEQKKMSEGDGFSLLGEEDLNGFRCFTRTMQMKTCGNTGLPSAKIS